MLDIFELINNGANYIVSLNIMNSFDAYIEKGELEYHLLVPNRILMDHWSIKKLFEKYYIQEIFEVSNCYLGSNNESYAYWHITKKKPTGIKTAIYYGYAHPYRDNENAEGKLWIPDKFNDDYKKYISMLEMWRRTGKQPADIKNSCKFNEINVDEFDYTKPYARFYRKSNSELRDLLRTVKIMPLKDIADIVRVSIKDRDDATRVKSLDPKIAPTYPYIPEVQAVKGLISTEKLYKGDIVELGLNHRIFFLIDKDSDFDLYAPLGRYIIRAKTVCPEYLYLYLNSKTAQRILHEFEIPFGDCGSTSLSSLEEFPVIVPQEAEGLYKERFLEISSPNKRFYITLNEQGHSKNLEQELLREIYGQVKLNNEKLIKKWIDKDLSELDICCSHGAYKATLILAGSIMEAFLIDWLSEIKTELQKKKVNYFEEQFRKPEWDKENNCYKKDKDGNIIYRNANLADYINEIRKIKKPEWMQEAEEAHQIREKRNLVHAKLCLKEDAEINDDMCRKVIRYLSNIIKSRLDEKL